MMDTIITDSFVESAASILGQMVGMTFRPGEVSSNRETDKSGNLLILIGLTGDLYGNVIICFPDELARQFAGAMMMMEVAEIDGIAQSAICELCNMLIGNAATMLSQKNIVVDITPPTILTGEKIRFHVEQSKLVNIPLVFEGGQQLEINISYKDYD